MTARPVNPNLTAALEDYLARRRALGFGLIEEERHARRFLEWLWASGRPQAGFTASDVVTWARGDGGLAHSYQRQRLAAVRGLARHCHAIGWMLKSQPPTRCAAEGIDAGPTFTPRTRSTH